MDKSKKSEEEKDDDPWEQPIVGVDLIEEEEKREAIKKTQKHGLNKEGRTVGQEG